MNNSAIGSTWEELKHEIFTPEEISESNLRVAVISEIIKSRQENGYSQKIKKINLKKIVINTKIDTCCD